jgi:hypothetical protein
MLSEVAKLIQDDEASPAQDDVGWLFSERQLLKSMTSVKSCLKRGDGFFSFLRSKK